MQQLILNSSKLLIDFFIVSFIYLFIYFLFLNFT